MHPPRRAARRATRGCAFGYQAKLRVADFPQALRIGIKRHATTRLEHPDQATAERDVGNQLSERALPARERFLIGRSHTPDFVDRSFNNLGGRDTPQVAQINRKGAIRIKSTGRMQRDAIKAKHAPGEYPRATNLPVQGEIGHQDSGQRPGQIPAKLPGANPDGSRAGGPGNLLNMTSKLHFLT